MLYLTEKIVSKFNAIEQPGGTGDLSRQRITGLRK
jgi:hypothetical protein